MLKNDLLDEKMKVWLSLHSPCPTPPTLILLLSLLSFCPLFSTLLPTDVVWFFSITFQAGNGTFNRAKLLNVGVREALRDEEWDCLFLHDVDLLPENDHNLYVCDPRGPRHVAVAMNKFGYR